MAASFRVNVSPAVLLWARRTAGLRPDEVAQRLKVAEGVVRAWEVGDDRPSLARLRKLATFYRRPLAALLLDEPPPEQQAVRDFRQAAEAGEMSPALRLAIRSTQERRSVALDLWDRSSLPDEAFSVTARVDDDPEEVGSHLRAALRVSMDEQAERSTPHAAFGFWRFRMEQAGVLVFGFPGVDFHEARGFSLSEQPLPAIAVNSRDAPAGRVFTLLHELAHIALRSGAVLCDLSERDTEGAHIERFCNHAAGAALVPPDDLLAQPSVRDTSGPREWTEEELKRLAKRYCTSREVVLRRLLILGRTSPAHYSGWRQQFVSEYESYAKRLRDSKGGPAYPTKMASQLGHLYPRIVLSAHEREAITTSAASDYLGMKVKHFDALYAEVVAGGS